MSVTWAEAPTKALRTVPARLPIAAAEAPPSSWRLEKLDPPARSVLQWTSNLDAELSGPDAWAYTPPPSLVERLRHFGFDETDIEGRACRLLEDPSEAIIGLRLKGGGPTITTLYLSATQQPGSSSYAIGPHLFVVDYALRPDGMRVPTGAYAATMIPVE